MRADDWLNESLGGKNGSAYYPGVTQVSQAQFVPIKAGEEVQADVVMHRIKTVEIAGRVIGTTGPATKAFISLEPADASVVRLVPDPLTPSATMRRAVAAPAWANGNKR